jgi:MerR family transcriptional regulator, light-induced transcriptional regulator
MTGGRDAIDAVAARFYSTHASVYGRFGDRGREACREDLSYHLDFLRPVLEFGTPAPMVEYLRWLKQVLTSRGVPDAHLALSVEWLAEHFALSTPQPEGRLIAKALRKVKRSFLKDDGSRPAIYSRMPTDWPQCEEFEGALLSGQSQSAAKIVGVAQAAGCSLIDIELHIIQPALYRIGQKWQCNQVSVAQEHLATAIAQAVMIQGLLNAQPATAIGRKILLACVQTNRHAVGLQMVADAFQLSGWSVNYLGADVPTTSLVSYAIDWKPDVIGLSVSLPHQLRYAKAVIRRVHELKDLCAKVVIGGLAINSFSSLTDQIGADLWSPDAAEAVIAAERLIA